jgi:CRISPR-associated protein Csm1
MQLSKQQRVEYNTVVLAGLLHDIGKFFNRLWKVWMKHPLASEKFIESPEMSRILQKKDLDIDLDLLKLLVKRHHEYYRFPENLKIQNIDDPHQQALAYVVSKSDNFSSSERDKEEERAREYYRKYRIYSLFSLINIKTGVKDDKYYQLQELSPGNIFPIDKDALDRKKYAYEQLDKQLQEELKSFAPGNFSELFNGLWNIFRKYLWAVPSDTTKKRSNISLFDHLSTTSAIAASLYLYHLENLDKIEIKNHQKEKFLLVGGDLSGIQDFLFEISQRNPKKLSKTLRGRSFLLSLLVEITALKILKALDLPYSAKLMSSGGRFIIMAPNCDEVIKILEKLEEEIEEEFFKKFLGKLTLTLDFSTTIKGKDFRHGKIKENINQVNWGLIRKKLNKNIHILKNKKYTEILKKPHGHMLQHNGACSFCEIFPKEEPGKDKKCLICNLSESLGEKIIRNRFLLFTEESEFFRFMGIGVQLTDDYRPNLLAYSLKDITNQDIYRGSISYGIANYLPKDEEKRIQMHNDDEKSLCYFCKKNNLEKDCDKDDRKTFKNTHLSFQCIATHTPLQRQGKGVDKLAVLKADIDNLGYIIQYGFDRLVDDEETSKYSVSRYTFLSRMIDAFFQHWLKHTIAEKYPMIYTVYAGGDDLLLIGSWADIIKFSYEFYKHFKAFVGNNPDITLSAGISLFSPHSPVTTAAQGAQNYLEQSKENTGKDSLMLFDTPPVKWEKLEELFEFADFLDKRLRMDEKESRINTAFLYRLFKYHRMFLDSEEGKIEGLRFHSLMNYDVVRNIERKEKVDGEDELLNPEELDKLRPLYASGKELNKELLKNLKIPLYIALFKNRGGKK